MSGPRLGMFGGAFDPPHIGHLIVARDAMERLELETLLIVPTGHPPHRTAVFPAERRLHFMQGACAGEPGFEVCDAEYRRPGPSYTVDTLEWIHRTRQPSELYLVVGADQLRAFATWHRHERVLELARLAVLTRAGDDPPRGGGIPYVEVDVTRVDLSSTRIRERLAAGRSIRYLVPESIRGEVEASWPRDGASGSGAPAPATPGAHG